MSGGYKVSYKLKPSYIPMNEAGSMREFQEKVIKFLGEKERVAILDCPTGSGKTFSFRQTGKNGNKTVIVLPNNLLAAEVAVTFGNDAVVLNKESILRHVEERKIEYEIRYTSLSSTIEEMISKKLYIITNPTVFYFLLLNRYNNSTKDDMISIIVKNTVKTIIFDEFHIYSNDQITMLMAAALAIPKGIKIIFSSATPQYYFTEFCKEVFGDSEVSVISVVREYQKNESNTLLQGPIQMNILVSDAAGFVENNIENFKDGKWIFILDSLRNVDAVGKLLVNKYPRSDIAFISAYYDPSYKNYKKILEDENSYRIVVSTNIIEQGINLSNQFTNFVIEPGNSLSNLKQRIGRVGRGNEKQSVVYLCIPALSQSIEIKDNTIDEIFNVFNGMNFKEAITISAVHKVGVYLFMLSQKLTPLAQKIILDNVFSYNNKELTAGILACKNVEETLTNREGMKIIKRNFIPEIFSISKWWNNYKKTIYSFIPIGSDKLDVIDVNYNFDENFLRTQYNQVWLAKNKEILQASKKGVIVASFNSKPNYDFLVKVKNLPDGDKILLYKDIAFSARKDIIDQIKSILNQSDYESNSKIERLVNNILSVTKDTAGLERLELEVEI